MKSKKLNKKKHVLLDVRAVKLLRKVQRQLRGNPRSYEQDEDRTPTKECGSQSCICGWMRWFAGSRAYWQNNPGEVFLTSNQFVRLFYRGRWPDEYRWAGVNSGTPPSVAIARINHFIETDGVE